MSALPLGNTKKITCLASLSFTIYKVGCQYSEEGCEMACEQQSDIQLFRQAVQDMGHAAGSLIFIDLSDFQHL